MKKQKKKILITGFSGFVATHFAEYLYRQEEKYSICGMDIMEPVYDYDRLKDRLDISFYKADMTQTEQVRQAIESFRPEYILHLASFSSVAYSWGHPVESFLNNCNIFLNLVSVVKEVCPACRILSVGSSEEYGNVTQELMPIHEDIPVHPLSPYAVARVSQEMLSRVYAESYHLDIMMTRSFNHIGPRQDERFVVPGFIKRALNLKKEGVAKGEIETGNVSIIRDFVDVRDVVRAYYLLLMKGKTGEIYNICSGTGMKLKKIVSLIGDICEVEIRPKPVEAYIRPNDNRVMIGSHDKITGALGWEPEIRIEDTIRDMVAYAEQKENNR